MSNKKVSELASAVAATANDLLLLVQNSISKSLSIEKLFGKISVPVNAESTFRFGGTPTAVTTGAVPLTGVVTHVTLSSTQTLTLGAGQEGQVKILVVVDGSGGAFINSNLWNATITLSNIGDTAHLLYTGGKWAFIGGSALAA